jgi:hypothetical protein
MSISDKNRKILWARSGNRCALCKCELVMSATDVDDDSIIGDECHIIAREANGPRGDSSWDETQLNDYNNLILLCKVHHKLVDDQQNTFTKEILHKMKEQHEEWVRETLEPKRRVSNKPEIAVRLLNGQDIVNITSKALLYDYGNDELRNPDETEIVGDFLQSIEDWGDILSEVGSKQTTLIAYEWTQEIQKLAEHGLFVFGALYRRKLKILDKVEEWPVAYIRIIHSDNPLIQSLQPPEASTDRAG